jgi:hypothetical protein
MAYKHTVYIPQHDNDHSESSYVLAPTIKSTLVEAFVVNFGGATVTEGYGYYKMSDGIRSGLFRLSVMFLPLMVSLPFTLPISRMF